jgi:hypothetical protein
VADGLVDRGAHRLWEMHIVQGRWVGLASSATAHVQCRIAYIALNTSLVDHLVDMVRRSTRLHLPRSNIQDLARQTADLAHPILLLLIQDRDVVPAYKLLLGPREAVLRVVGMGDGFGNGPRRRQGVDGAQGAGVLEGGERIELSGGWVWFRNYLWREQVGEDITLRLVHGLVFALSRGVSTSAQRVRVRHTCCHTRKPTQLRLKQS